MRWFLRLFPLFREMENGSSIDLANAREEVERLLTEKRILEDRLDAAVSDHERMWAALQETLSNERFALRTQINHLTQKSGAGTPYPEAHRIPESLVLKPQEPGAVGRRGRVLPSQLARQQTIENLRRMAQEQAQAGEDGTEVIAQ